MTGQLHGQLAALARRTEAAEQRILDAAVSRLEEVTAKLEALRPLAVVHGGEEYLGLVGERGRLERVISQARANGASLGENGKDEK